MELALGRVKECPFEEEEVKRLQEAVVSAAARFGQVVKSCASDRKDVPIDFAMRKSQWVRSRVV